MITLYLSACGLDVDRGKKVDQNISNLTETDMTGIWLSESTAIFTSKNDGQILDNTTRKSYTYIEDTENGIGAISCEQMIHSPTGEPYGYQGTKTNDKYFPFGEEEPSDYYLFDKGTLVQAFKVDEAWGDHNATKSVHTRLTYVDSKEIVYTDGTISLSLNDELALSATTEICTQGIKQTPLERNESTRYRFTFPYEGSEDRYIDLVFSFDDIPPPGLYNLVASDTEVVLQDFYIFSNRSYDDGGVLSNIRGFEHAELGWLDLISADKDSFEGNFSFTLTDSGVLTGYINVDISGLQ